MPDFTKEIVKPSFLNQYTSLEYFLHVHRWSWYWAALQKSHGVKDIAMRHWGVLRSSIREVGCYLVVSSPTLAMLSTPILFLHVYTDVYIYIYIYMKRKEISTLCSFVSLASDRINNTHSRNMLPVALTRQWPKLCINIKFPRSFATLWIRCRVQ